MNKIFWSSAAIAATMAVSAMAADIALVVQNVRYQNLPINSDIGPAFADYAQAYRDSGFEVIEAENPLQVRAFEFVERYAPAIAHLSSR